MAFRYLKDLRFINFFDVPDKHMNIRKNYTSNNNRVPCFHYICKVLGFTCINAFTNVLDIREYTCPAPQHLLATE